MRVLAAELLKIWTAPRTLLGILLSELAIVLLLVIATLYPSANDAELHPEFAQDLVGIASTSLFFATLMGVLIATTEYRHGTMTITFLAAPVREKVIAAKIGAAVIASAALALPAVLLVVGIAEIWVGGRDDYHLGSQEYELVGRMLLMDAIAAMIGVFLGSSLKRQLAAIILVLGWLSLVEGPLVGLLPGTTDYLVGPAIGGMLGDSGPDIPSFGRALAVFSAYLAGLGAVAVVLTRRRDIS